MRANSDRGKSRQMDRLVRTRGLKWWRLVLPALIALGPSGALGAAACTLDRASGTTIDHAPFLRGGYGIRWNLSTDRLAFMQPDASGYYRIFAMNPNQTGRVELGVGLANLPPGHRGMVYWQPSGRYLIFTAQKAAWKDTKMFGVPAYGALPGFGVHDDMWVIRADGSQAWQLTDEPNTKRQGVLLPIFSPDGSHVVWADRQPDKTYSLDIADFVETPAPHLANIRVLLPGGQHYYEPGSFSSDGRSLFYTSDRDTHHFWLSQIYRLDFGTGLSTRLTRGLTYNEHPVAIATPGGDWVVYMSTQGVQRRHLHFALGTDWWAMRPDGLGAKRLTTMNVRNPDNPENLGAVEVATTVAISPSGTFMLGDTQDSLVHQTGLDWIVRFTCL